MINLEKTKNPMPQQKPEERIKNFEEVELGYTEEMAINEALRCLKCRKKPCTQGCPVNIRIPYFIDAVSRGEFEEAYQIISDTSALPAICGRVCPQENQCEGNCVQGKFGEPVAIGRLERFVADWHRENYENSSDEIEKNGHKVAVVGSGPSGLTCAGDLALLGYDVTVYESLHKAGGVLSYGIPQFRLPKDIVENEVDKIEKRGVKIVKDAIVGRTVKVNELLSDGYDAVYLATGAGIPKFMNIEGEDLVGVFSANEYLSRINLMKANDNDYDTPMLTAKNIAVIGGGNVAMDAAACAVRMGAENVYVVYRRSMDELPARVEEVKHAKVEGVQFKLLNNPVRIIGDRNDHVAGLECVEMKLGEADESGRRRPVPVENSNFVMDVDCVIMAIGSDVNNLALSDTPAVKTSNWGEILTEEGTKTTGEGIFAGGDAVTGPATVILAMKAGKQAAKDIDSYIKG